jgi:serine/threonine-protein kinase ATR
MGLVLPMVTIEEHIQIKGNPDLHVEGCTYGLSNAITSVRHACHLLSIITKLVSASAVSYDATAAFQGYLAWILDSYSTIRDAERAYVIDYSTPASVIELYQVDLDSLHTLLTSLEFVLTDSIKRKGHRLISCMCADFLNCSDAIPQEDHLCEILINLSAACAQFDHIRQDVSSVLVPALNARYLIEEYGQDKDIRA